MKTHNSSHITYQFIIKSQILCQTKINKTEELQCACDWNSQLLHQWIS